MCRINLPANRQSVRLHQKQAGRQGRKLSQQMEAPAELAGGQATKNDGLSTVFSSQQTTKDDRLS